MEPTPIGLDLEIFTLALPLTLGVVQLLKEAGLPARWAGLAALVVGLLAGIAVHLAGIPTASGVGDDLRLAALSGIVAGLSAAGVWSGTKAIYEP